MNDRDRHIALAMQKVLIDAKVGTLTTLEIMFKAYQAACRADEEFSATRFPSTPKGQVRIGQVWEDNDKRQGLTPRRGEVVKIIGDYAEVKWNTDRTTQIHIKRFRPNSTGYRLIKDVE